MLCPEVWNFKAPQSTFTTQTTNQSDNSTKTINSFTYSHLISTNLPDTFKVQDNLTEALKTDCDYYKIDNLQLSEFVKKEFLTSFIECGNLYVLSINTRIDCDNCVCITPTGHLILSLNKTCYQSLGVEGHVSHYHTKSKDRYIVKIDLKQLKVQKSHCQRVKQALDKLERFTVILIWTPPPQQGICPSSVAKYFDDLDYKIKLCQTQFNTNTQFCVIVPNIKTVIDDDFIEWLGMLSTIGDLEGSYTTPEPDKVVGQIKCLQWRGFFTKAKIENYWNILKKFRQDNDLDWVSMYVQGFSDSPVAWGLQEHHYYTNGDNGYILVATKDNNLIGKQECSRKRYRKTSI